MAAKSDFLQIRVSSSEKLALRRLAEQAGMDLSSFVLSRALPAARLRFEELVAAARAEEDVHFVMAELNDLLSDLPAAAFRETVGSARLDGLSPLAANCIAAMVEQAAALKSCAPPAWTRDVEALELPWFASELRSLRPWLLASSPAAWRRRNLFVDSAIGARV